MSANLATHSFVALVVEQLEGIELDNYLELAYVQSTIGTSPRRDETDITVDGFPGHRFQTD